MSLYDIAYVTWPVLLALLVAVPSVLLFANRRAWKNGYDEGHGDGYTKGYETALCDYYGAKVEPPIDLTERLKPYVSRVDPPGSHY